MLFVCSNTTIPFQIRVKHLHHTCAPAASLPAMTATPTCTRRIFLLKKIDHTKANSHHIKNHHLNSLLCTKNNPKRRCPKTPTTQSPAMRKRPMTPRAQTPARMLRKKPTRRMEATASHPATRAPRIVRATRTRTRLTYTHTTLLLQKHFSAVEIPASGIAVPA